MKSEQARYVPPGRRSHEGNGSGLDESDFDVGKLSIDKKDNSNSKTLDGKRPTSARWAAPYVPPSRRSTTASASAAEQQRDSPVKAAPTITASAAAVNLGNEKLSVFKVTPVSLPERKPSSIADRISVVNDATTKSSSSSSSSGKAALTSGQATIAIYVPPGRRQLEEEIAKEQKERPKTLRQIELSWEEDPQYSKSDDDRYIPPAEFLEDHSVRRCSVVVRGIPAHLPEFSKEAMLLPFTERGAAVRWISPTEALLVLPSSGAVRAARAVPHNNLLSITTLDEMDDDEAKEFTKVSAEMLESIKPERDARVANRMIGAALGIAIPRKAQASATSGTMAGPQKKSRASSPPKQDAWDD